MRKIFFILILFINFSFANFIGMNDGARALSMGNAYVALSDESSAIFHNPAGLANIRHIDFIASRQKLYGISELSNDMLAISFPTPILRIGFAAQQIGLSNEYLEKIIYLSIAGIVRPGSTPVRFGMNMKYESAEVKNYEAIKSNNPSNLDLDLGILIDVTKDLFFGYSVKNILEPEFEFISTSDKLDKTHTIGICYNWRSSVNFLADYIWTDINSHWNFGSEIWFFNIFAARLGVYDEKLTTGFGLKTKKWSVDTAILTHQNLGSTYRISFSLRMGR